MRKYLLLMGLLAFLSSCGGLFRYTSPSAQKQATVSVEVSCPNGGGGYGSGVIVGPHHVLTAAHVVDNVYSGECSVTVTEIDGLTRNMKVDWFDKSHDIARLRTVGDLSEFDNYERIWVGKRPDEGDQVYLVTGYPLRGRKLGLVEGYHDGSGDVIHSGLTEFGNSGSGVWNESGKLIGIVTNLYYCQNQQFCGGRFTSLWSQRFLLRP